LIFAIFRKIPQACFRVGTDLVGKSDSQLPQLLSQYLGIRFKSTAPVKQPFGGPWIIRVQVAPNTTFMIGLSRGQRERDMWLLQITPGRVEGDTGGLLAYLRGRIPKEDSQGLLPACREIQLFLTSTPDISAVRWFFKGSRKAVHTPDELLSD
jgi:hypothetical protein